VVGSGVALCSVEPGQDREHEDPFESDHAFLSRNGAKKTGPLDTGKHRKKHAEIPEQMKPRGRYRGDQAHHEVFWLEEDRSGAVLPDALQA
jgi:hypothetical protein